MKTLKVAFTPQALKDIRTRKLLSIRDLHKISGVSAGMISLIEDNQAAPSEMVLRSLGQALNVIFTCDWTQERAEPKRKVRRDDSKSTDEESEGTAGE